MRLDDDLIASFKEFGAVLLPKVISEGWVKKLREGVEYNMSTPGKYTRNYTDKTSPGGFLGIIVIGIVYQSISRSFLSHPLQI